MPPLGLDVGDDASTPLGITNMRQHARAGLPELASDEPADPICQRRRHGCPRWQANPSGFQIRLHKFSFGIAAGVAIALVLSE